MNPDEVQEALEIAEGEVLRRLREYPQKITDAQLVSMVKLLREQAASAYEATLITGSAPLDLSGLPPERAAVIREALRAVVPES